MNEVGIQAPHFDEIMLSNSTNIQHNNCHTHKLSHTQTPSTGNTKDVTKQTNSTVTAADPEKLEETVRWINTIKC